MAVETTPSRRNLENKSAKARQIASDVLSDVVELNTGLGTPGCICRRSYTKEGGGSSSRVIIIIMIIIRSRV